MSYSPTNTVTTVARREIALAAKNRGIMVSLALTLILMLGGIGVASWLSNRDASEPAGEADAIAVLDLPEEAVSAAGLTARTVTDHDEAQELVAAGDVEAALVPAAEGGGWELLSDGPAGMSLSTAAQQILEAHAQARAFGELGVDPAAYAQALPATALTAVDISETDATDGTGATLLVAFFGVFIMFFALMLFAGNIGSRVTEEKSSRVVELILAAVRPLDFLAGKIIGNVLFGAIATGAVLVVGGVALAASGLVEQFSFDWAIIPVILVAFLLGMIFYGALYAAAGAMVQRTEDLQSTQMPILFLIMISIYVGSFGMSNLDATWMVALGWVPPVSVVVAPLQYAAGNFSLLEVAGSFALMAVVTFLVIWLVARIYRAAILHNGQKMGWLQALRAQPA